MSKPSARRVPFPARWIVTVAVIAAVALLAAGRTGLTHRTHAAQPRSTARPVAQTSSPAARLTANYAALPLAFEANRGQADAPVQYIARGTGYKLTLTSSEAVMTLRKGRVDEIFFIDLPNEDERREIFRIHTAKRKRNPAKFDLDALARMSDGFSGAEIEESIISGLYDAFSQGTDLDTSTLAAGIAETVPLSQTMSEELARLRNWAQGRARPATGQIKQAEPTETRRKLEI